LTTGFFVALLCADDAGRFPATFLAVFLAVLLAVFLDATEPDAADFRGAVFCAAELRAFVRLVDELFDELFVRVVVFRAGISPP